MNKEGKTDQPQESVFAILDALHIPYQTVYHQAVFSAEEGRGLDIFQNGDMCKNLFLRDAQGKRHFLVIVYEDKKVDLKSIQNQLGSSRLGFASEERLFQYLKLHKGEVTPFGIINDPDALVEVVLDYDLAGKNKLGFHPNVNTATVWISFDDLLKVIKHKGNTIHFVTI